MSEQEFIEIHNATLEGNINNAFQINVNIAEEIPQYTHLAIPQQGYITGITVTPYAKFVDNVPGVYIRDILQQIEQIRFFFDNNEYSLNVLNRSFFYNNDLTLVPDTDPAEAGHSYFYFRVEPFLMPIYYTSAELPVSINDVVINFSPFITDLQFAFSNYNVLLNNATEIRRSEVAVESNRNERQAIPDNFNPIYTGSAVAASIQDSYYTSVSWKNSRYDGAKSTPFNYAGVSPSLVGRSFEGELFPQDAFNDVVCLTPSDSRLYEEFFHNGQNTLPTYELTDIGPAVNGTFATGDPTLALNPARAVTGSIDTGDILIIGDEKMRVENYLPNENPPLVVVQRGYAGTSEVTHNQADNILKIKELIYLDLEQQILELHQQ